MHLGMADLKLTEYITCRKNSKLPDLILKATEKKWQIICFNFSLKMEALALLEMNEGNLNPYLMFRPSVSCKSMQKFKHSQMFHIPATTRRSNGCRI